MTQLEIQTRIIDKRGLESLMIMLMGFMQGS